jgi:hypothetical protein
VHPQPSHPLSCLPQAGHPPPALLALAMTLGFTQLDVLVQLGFAAPTADTAATVAEAAEAAVPAAASDLSVGSGAEQGQGHSRPPQQKVDRGTPPPWKAPTTADAGAGRRSGSGSPGPLAGPGALSAHDTPQTLAALASASTAGGAMTPSAAGTPQAVQPPSSRRLTPRAPPFTPVGAAAAVNTPQVLATPTLTPTHASGLALEPGPRPGALSVRDAAAVATPTIAAPASTSALAGTAVVGVGGGEQRHTSPTVARGGIAMGALPAASGPVDAAAQTGGKPEAGAAADGFFTTGQFTAIPLDLGPLDAAPVGNGAGVGQSLPQAPVLSLQVCCC